MKSGSLASAAQSAAVGALGVNFCAWAIALDMRDALNMPDMPDTSNRAKTKTMAVIAERILVLGYMRVKIAWTNTSEGAESI